MSNVHSGIISIQSGCLRHPRRNQNLPQHRGKDGKRFQSPSCTFKGCLNNYNAPIRDMELRPYTNPVTHMRNLLVKPGDKMPDARKCGVVYHISCASCDSSYVGETARSLQKRLSEHKKTRDDPNTVTGVGEHCANTGHTINDQDTKILAREDQWWRRKISESIEIYTNQPDLNRDQGYELPPIYKQVLSHDVHHHSHVTESSM